MLSWIKSLFQDSPKNKVRMNPTILKSCAWSGPLAVFMIGMSFWLAGFIPIPSPSLSAEQISAMIIADKNVIRAGMILAMMASAFLLPFSAVISIHIRQIEGRYPVLAYTQLGLGAILVLEFIYLLFFWQTATFRIDRSPELIQLLNDMAWIPFVGLSSTLIMQAAIVGLAILIDKKPTPVFPRWLGFFSLFAAFMFLPGSFNVFFMHGPFSWNGLIAIYIPSVIFFTWSILIGKFAASAVDRLASDDLIR